MVSESPTQRPHGPYDTGVSVFPRSSGLAEKVEALMHDSQNCYDLDDCADVGGGEVVDPADAQKTDTKAAQLKDQGNKQLAAKNFAKAATTVAAVSKVRPRSKFKTAWRVLDVWRVKCPPRQAATVPIELAFAIGTWLTTLGKGEIAAVILLCFVGLL